MSDQGGNGGRKVSGRIQLTPPSAAAVATTALAPNAFKDKAPQTDSPDPLVGQTIGGRFSIQEQLRVDSGMGVLYRAIDNATGMEVVVKSIKETTPIFVARFDREVKAMNRLTHPNIVAFVGSGELPDGRPYYAMEYLRGHCLGQDAREMRRKKTVMDWERLRELMRPVCDALSAIHAAGITHRDLKPDNIFIHVIEVEGANKERVKQELVKLIDFGIARLPTKPGDVELTRVGQGLGSAVYMSPEQIQAPATCDARSDVYSLGVIMYLFLTGYRPFDGKNIAEIYKGHLFDSPVPPCTRRPDANIPKEFEAIVMKALSKDPVDRYQSAEELHHDLDAIDGSEITDPILNLSSATARTKPDPVIDMSSGDILADDFMNGVEEPDPDASGPVPAATVRKSSQRPPSPSVEVDKALGPRRTGFGWVGLALVGTLATGGGVLLSRHLGHLVPALDAQVSATDAGSVVQQADSGRRRGYAVTIRTTRPVDVYSLAANGRTITKIGDTTTPYLYQSPDQSPHSLVLLRPGVTFNGRRSLRLDLSPASSASQPDISIRTSGSARDAGSRSRSRHGPREPLVETQIEEPVAPVVIPSGPAPAPRPSANVPTTTPSVPAPQQTPDPEEPYEIDSNTGPRH